MGITARDAGWVIRVTGGEPRFLWVHGLGESSLCFGGISRRLEGFGHILVDLPGYGRTLPPPAPLPLAAVARELGEMVIRYGWHDAILVGHSMGGVVGTLLLESLGPVVAGFINVEGNVSLGDCTLSAQVASWDQDAFLRHGFREVWESVFRRGTTSRAHRGYAVSLAFAHPPSLFLHARELVEISRQEVMARAMGLLRSPVLYVGGEGGVCERSLGLLRHWGVPVEMVPSGGHWPFLDNPDLFAQLVTDFAAKVWGLADLPEPKTH